jgi:hypothetical protein
VPSNGRGSLAILAVTGFLLKQPSCAGESIPLGCLHINNLQAMTEIPLDATNDSLWIEVLMGKGQLLTPLETLSAASREQLDTWREMRKTFRAFDLDNTCTSGRVALLYAAGPLTPQVWFQDLAGQWFFVSRCFIDYFRVLVMHLGLPNWQYAFTEVGLDEHSKHWLRFFSAERLDINTSNHVLLCTRRRRFLGEEPLACETLALSDKAAERQQLQSARSTGAGDKGSQDGRRGLDLENLDKTAQLQCKGSGGGVGSNGNTSSSSSSSSANAKSANASKKKPGPGRRTHTN